MLNFFIRTLRKLLRWLEEKQAERERLSKPLVEYRVTGHLPCKNSCLVCGRVVMGEPPYRGHLEKSKCKNLTRSFVTASAQKEFVAGKDPVLMDISWYPRKELAKSK